MNIVGWIAIIPAVCHTIGLGQTFDLIHIELDALCSHLHIIIATTYKQIDQIGSDRITQTFTVFRRTTCQITAQPVTCKSVIKALAVVIIDDHMIYVRSYRIGKPIS